MDDELQQHTVPEEQRPAVPDRSRGRVYSLALALLLTAALAAWWLASRPEPAVDAAGRFVHATMSGSYGDVAPYLSHATLHEVGASSNARSRFLGRLREYLTAGYTDPREATFAVDGYQCEGKNIARVRVKLVDDSDEMLTYIREQFPQFARTWLVMVREGGEWKFDLPRSSDRQVINPGYCREERCLTD